MDRGGAPRRFFRRNFRGGPPRGPPGGQRRGPPRRGKFISSSPQLQRFHLSLTNSPDYSDGQNGDLIDDQPRNDNYRPRPRFRGGNRGGGGGVSRGIPRAPRGKGPKDNQQVQNTVTESTA